MKKKDLKLGIAYHSRARNMLYRNAVVVVDSTEQMYALTRSGTLRTTSANYSHSRDIKCGLLVVTAPEDEALALAAVPGLSDKAVQEGVEAAAAWGKEQAGITSSHARLTVANPALFTGTFADEQARLEAEHEAAVAARVEADTMRTTNQTRLNAANQRLQDMLGKQAPVVVASYRLLDSDNPSVTMSLRDLEAIVAYSAAR